MHGCDSVVSPQLRIQRDKQCRGRLCVHKNGMSAKTRKFVVLKGFGPNHNLGVYNNNVDVVERAYIERYFLCKDGDSYRPALDVKKPAFLTREFTDFRKLVSEKMPCLPVMTRPQCVAAYHGPKRQIYEKAMLSLEKEGLSARDAKLSGFGKFEKVDIGKAPRGINPRTSRYNLELARYLKHAEHHFFRAINYAWGRRTRATVIKGMNAELSAETLYEKWMLFVDPVAIGLDATKFDMHVSIRALLYEHSFYKALYPRDRKLVRLLRWQLRNQGVVYLADGTIKYEMEGTRSSGDINTSLGNCILMCAMVWAYAKSRGIDCELANNGDDCVVFMERTDAESFRSGLSEWFKARGFAMTVEDTVDEFEKVEFCQTHPVKLSTGWRMIRNLTAVMQKDPMCLLPIPNVDVLRKWMDAVGTGGGRLGAGVPVLQAFYGAMKRHGKACGKLIDEVYRGQSQLQLGEGLKQAVIEPASRVSYYYAFGVTPDEQLALEDHYNRLEIKFDIEGPIARTDLELNPGHNILDILTI